MYALKEKKFTTRTMVLISFMGVIAFVLMLLDFPVPLVPPFIKFDISDLPALIGGFILGPIAGVLIELLKNVLKLIAQGSNTGGVGELSNFMVGSIFVYTAAFIYHNLKSKNSALIGVIVGTLVMSICISAINYFFMIPFYAKVFGMPLDAIIDMGKSVNLFVKDFKSLIVFSILPFNLLKGTIVSGLTLLLYKSISSKINLK